MMKLIIYDLFPEKFQNWKSVGTNLTSILGTEQVCLSILAPKYRTTVPHSLRAAHFPKGYWHQ